MRGHISIRHLIQLISLLRLHWQKGHEIFRVFFYHDGVNNATRLGEQPQDNRNITQQWTELPERT